MRVGRSHFHEAVSILGNSRGMTSTLPMPRLSAAMSGLGGLILMMLQPGPSVASVLSGLASIFLCLGFSVIPRQRRHEHAGPVEAQTVTRSAPRDEPPPFRILEPLKKPEMIPSNLPEFPSHRQRVKERQANRRR